MAGGDAGKTRPALAPPVTCTSRLPLPVPLLPPALVGAGAPFPNAAGAPAHLDTAQTLTHQPLDSAGTASQPVPVSSRNTIWGRDESYMNHKSVASGSGHGPSPHAQSRNHSRAERDQTISFADVQEFMFDAAIWSILCCILLLDRSGACQELRVPVVLCL